MKILNREKAKEKIIGIRRRKNECAEWQAGNDRTNYSMEEKDGMITNSLDTKDPEEVKQSDKDQLEELMIQFGYPLKRKRIDILSFISGANWKQPSSGTIFSKEFQMR